jgi:hypothetical protein
MKRLAFVSATLLLLVACSDETPADRAPTAPAAPSFAQSAAVPRGLSTVCLSYSTQLANTHEKLEKLHKEQRADAALETKLAKKVESFEKLVTDACR